MTDRAAVRDEHEQVPVQPVRRWQSFLPAVAAIILVIATMLVANTPLLDILRYTAYFVIGLMIPGVLVHRALRGRPNDIVADLSLGGAVGVVVGMIGWAVFVALGIGKLLFLWPLLIIVLFAAVPALRKHFTIEVYPERIGASGWLIAVALGFYTVALAVLHWHGQALPPKANFYYIDQYFHIANAAELTKAIPPETPSVAGRPLHYHWFVNSHVASGHMISGVDIPTTYLRLFEPPLVGIILGLLFTMTRMIVKRNWAAGLATILLVAPNQLVPWGWFKPWGPYALTEGSPSQTFGVMFVLLGGIVLLPMLLEKKLSWGSWAILAAVGIGGAGTKPAVLPVLLFGLGCVFLVMLFQRRTFWPLLIAIGVLLAGFVGLSALTSQASSGSGIKVFGFLYFFRLWTGYVNEKVYPGTGPWIIPGLGEPGAWKIAIALITSVLMQFAFILAAVGLVRRKLRWNPILVFLLGGWFIGMVLAFIIDHPGQSEIYFARTGTPFGIILAVWGLAAALDAARERRSDRTVAGLAAGSAVLGVVFGYVVVRSGYGSKPGRTQWAGALAEPMVLLLVGTAVLIAIYYVLRLTVGKSLLIGTGAMIFCTALLAMMTVQGPWSTTRSAMQIAGGQEARPLPTYKVTEDEMAGLLWLKDNTPVKATMATNMHCYEKKTVERCSSRSYWMPAFSERRYLVETWAYTVETLKQVGQYPGSFPQYPFDDPEKLRINDQAFTDPTPQVLNTLRDKYGVKYLVGIVGAGPISPQLNTLASPKFSNDDIRIFELK